MTDDGDGRLQLNSEQIAHPCSGCGRVVGELGDLRGRCDWCRVRECCDRCVSRCQVCSRQLCGQCRHGFAGPPQLTVCALCLERLLVRQRLHDRRAEADAEFSRQMEQQRLFNQVETLRLNAERARIALELQAARLGLGQKKRPLLVRAVGLVGRGAVAVVNHVWRGLS